MKLIIILCCVLLKCYSAFNITHHYPRGQLWNKMLETNDCMNCLARYDNAYYCSNVDQPFNFPEIPSM